LKYKKYKEKLQKEMEEIGMIVNSNTKGASKPTSSNDVARESAA
jgi:hypothetical protein